MVVVLLMLRLGRVAGRGISEEIEALASAAA